MSVPQGVDTPVKLGGRAGMTKQRSHLPVERIESRTEDSSGREDWRTAHRADLARGNPLRFQPTACSRCWKLEIELQEAEATPAERAQRLVEEELTDG